MKDGKYTIDSIEDGIVRLLYREDEYDEEYLNVSEFPIDIEEGLIVEVKTKNDRYIIQPLYQETEQRKKQMRGIMEKLKKRK
ncbi:DUF3006 family protein [Indiicoccus explosivorum]|uniref:DUF3006 family protein n=1 Tax=Indiicoccus explosivorum TaxID=1917864 RepID=UPI000B439778|nr:DUF3006 family protein [Indiicoccus explosivorum]